MDEKCDVSCSLYRLVELRRCRAGYGGRGLVLGECFAAICVGTVKRLELKNSFVEAVVNDWGVLPGG